jgi:hypothetical protein
MSYEKTASEDWFIKVNSDGTKSASFTNKGQIGKQMWAEMLASGETASEYIAPIPEPLTWDEQRRIAYPSYATQLDEIFHNGIDSWKAVIQITKDKYPKPE